MIFFFGKRTMIFFNHVSISSLFRPKYLILSLSDLLQRSPRNGLQNLSRVTISPNRFPIRERRCDLHGNWHCHSWSLTFPVIFLPAVLPLINFSSRLLFHLIILIFLPRISFQFDLPFLPVSWCQTIFFTLKRMTDEFVVLDSLHFLCDYSCPIFSSLSFQFSFGQHQWNPPHFPCQVPFSLNVLSEILHNAASFLFLMNRILSHWQHSITPDFCLQCWRRPSDQMHLPNFPISFYKSLFRRCLSSASILSRQRSSYTSKFLFSVAALHKSPPASDLWGFEFWNFLQSCFLLPTGWAPQYSQ